MRIGRTTLLASLAVLMAGGFGLAAAQQNPQGAPATPPLPPMRISSTAFADSTPIPTKYTCSAQPAPVSPPLAWTDVPAGTMSFALIVHDLEPRPRKGVEDSLHWMIWNIPATATSLPEGVPSANADLPDGSRQSQPGSPAPGFRGP